MKLNKNLCLGEYSVERKGPAIFKLAFNEPLTPIHCVGDKLFSIGGEGQHSIINGMSGDRKSINIIMCGFGGVPIPTGEIYNTGEHYLIEK